MPITISEMVVEKPPPEVYSVGTYTDITIKNPHIIPWRYYLIVLYYKDGEVVYRDDFKGFLKGRTEETIHSETHFPVDKVVAKIGTTRLAIWDRREMDP